MKRILILSLTLNIILIGEITAKKFFASSSLKNCRTELNETLYLLDAANFVLKNPTTRLDKKNPYYKNLTKAGNIYYF